MLKCYKIVNNLLTANIDRKDNKDHKGKKSMYKGKKNDIIVAELLQGKWCLIYRRFTEHTFASYLAKLLKHLNRER